MREVSTDILILGSGGAGLFAALHAHKADPSLSITVAVKGLLGKCGCTRMVQGGYNVALAKEDSIERHFMDTIEGGKWLPDQELAWKLVDSGRRKNPGTGKRAGLLLRPQPGRHGAPEGLRRADLRPHGAQGRPDRHRDHQPARRAGLGAQDQSARGTSGGRTDQGQKQFRDRRRPVHRHAHAANTSSCARRRCCSPPAAGRPCTSTTRPRATRAATAWRWRCAPGFPLRDMEMVQFHPTGLYAGTHTRMTGTVLEEGLRGSGGYLLNGAKERFMPRYDPQGRARDARFRLAGDVRGDARREIPARTAGSTFP